MLVYYDEIFKVKMEKRVPNRSRNWIEKYIFTTKIKLANKYVQINPYFSGKIV